MERPGKAIEHLIFIVLLPPALFLRSVLGYHTFRAPLPVFTLKTIGEEKNKLIYFFNISCFSAFYCIFILRYRLIN